MHGMGTGGTGLYNRNALVWVFSPGDQVMVLVPR